MSFESITENNFKIIRVGEQKEKRKDKLKGFDLIPIQQILYNHKTFLTSTVSIKP